MSRNAPARPKVVFLDRDGVINRDSADYIKSWAEFEFLPGSLAAMARLTRAGFSLILITNQSAVARGLISRTGLGRLHQRLRAAVAEQGGYIKEIFYCPHHPDEGCHCRKPRSGLLEQAAAKYGLDLAETVFVGDSVKDIDCARAGGCNQNILLRTGNGPSALETLTRRGQPPDYVADDLLDAACYIETNSTIPYKA
jgi:D-glycero-D-manno-heptose 1,7-bisphosphate phosphatase